MSDDKDLIERLHEIAHRDSAVAVTVRTEDLRALLSKLRAPVAVESPMAKMAEALREKARQEQQDYQDRRNQATEWGPMPEGTEADRPIPIAPVAHVAGDETSRYLEWAKDRSAWEMPVGTPVYYSVLASAPVAGEALNDLQALQWAEKHGLQWAIGSPDTIREVIADAQRLAAPQASEAVLHTILHSVRQARIAGNDWRRELALIENTVSAALSAQPGAQMDEK